MRRFLVAFSLLLFAVPLHLSAAQSPSTIPQEAPAASQVEGQWRMSPLVMKGAQVPEMDGQFQEFGEAYVLENALVFWARFGPGEKDWGLFSLKEGKLAKIFLEDIEFVAPDSRRVKVRRDTPQPPVFHAGKRILYISMKNPDHVYGWDGERLVRVLCAGDQLDVSGVRYTVKKATVINVGPDGRALIYYDANQPQHINGWVLHDGTTFTPVWKEGDALPGMPGVQIKNLSAGHFCFFSCVGAPWLLEDGSILAPLEVTGAPYKTALFHVSRDKTEKIIAEKTQEPGSPYIERLGDLLVARSDSFVMDASWTLVTSTSSGPYVLTYTYYEHPELLVYHQGKFRVESFVGARELLWLVVGRRRNVSFAFDRAMFLTPDSPHLLVTLKVSKITELFWKSQGVFNSFPGLYFWDGEKLSPVPWETALGMDISAVLKTLESEPKRALWNLPSQPKVIGLRRIGGPASGAGILLPTGGSTGAQWFIPSNSVNGELERGPQFQVAGRTVTVADVVAWKSPEQALVELEDGFFLLTKTADTK